MEDEIQEQMHHETVDGTEETEEAIEETVEDIEDKLDALVELLVEKGIITEEELDKRVDSYYEDVPEGQETLNEATVAPSAPEQAPPAPEAQPAPQNSPESQL